MIAAAEGTTKFGYHTLVGNTKIADLSKHPNKVVRLSATLSSTAAGRYQFLFRTWKPIALALDLPDFGPRSQDLACVELLRECGALPIILDDGQPITQAIHAARKIWASFPGAGYGQSERSLSFMLGAYYAGLKSESNSPPAPTGVSPADDGAGAASAPNPPQIIIDNLNEIGRLLAAAGALLQHTAKLMEGEK